MNLLEHDVESFFFGCVRVEHLENGICPRRMTSKQQLWLGEQAEGYGIRARCPAGCVLAVRTDAPRLVIRLVPLKGAREYYGLDVEVDNTVIRGFRMDMRDGPQKLELFNLAAGPMRNVKVYLPVSVEVAIQSIELPDGAIVESLPPPEKRLLCLGDSITQGMNARSPMAAYPTQLGQLMAMEVLNQGIGGYIFETSWLDTELPFRPEIITVAYGTNDWSRGLEPNRIRSNVQAFMVRLREVFPANESTIVVVSPIWRNDFNTVRQGGDLREFSRVILETAAEFGDAYTVNGIRLLPNQDWYVEDGVHPNDLGFLHYATRLYEEIRSLAV